MRLRSSSDSNSNETRVIKACLFDLDGTLIDTTADIATAVNHTRAALDLPALSEGEVAHGIGHGARALLRACLPAEHHPELERHRERFIESYRAHLHDQTCFHEGAEEALLALRERGVKIGIVTNKPAELTAPLLNALGWEGRFDLVIGREEGRLAKPHPDPLFRAMSALEVDSSEALYVGDSEVDAQAALAAGIEFLVVPYGRAASDVHTGLYGPRARVMTWGDLRGASVPGGTAYVEEPSEEAESPSIATPKSGVAEESPRSDTPALIDSTSPQETAELTHKSLARSERLTLGLRNVAGQLASKLELDEVLKARLIEDYKEHFLGRWDHLIIALSVYTLLSLIAQLLWPISVDMKGFLRLIDQIICGFFLVDFVFRFSFSSDRLAYLKWGWLDLISSIPTLDSIRWGRALRLFRLIRALRAMKTLHKKLEHRLQDTFSLVLMTSLFITIMSAIGALHLEHGAEGANINSPEDALWWAWVTITTVGYGDYYPVTTSGRILATFLMSAGVGLFSVLTVECTRYFLDSAAEEDALEIKGLKEELRSLRELVLTLKLSSPEPEHPKGAEQKNQQGEPHEPQGLRSED